MRRTPYVQRIRKEVGAAPQEVVPISLLFRIGWGSAKPEPTPFYLNYQPVGNLNLKPGNLRSDMPFYANGNIFVLT